MQFGKLVKGSAVLFAVCCVGNCLIPGMAQETVEQKVVVSDTHFTPYLNAVRLQNERDARAALIAKLRQVRDEVRNYALIARGGKMTDEQKAAGTVLKAIKDSVSSLQAKAPGTNVDPQDNAQVDPLLFELGCN
jgi:hypothetical protein